MIAAGGCLLSNEVLAAQETHTFSNVVELGDGRVAAADATLIDDSTVSFLLMAPGLDLEWVEIRDREQGGSLLATTRSTGNGRGPHLELIGMGEVLNEPGDDDVTIGLEDFVVELSLHAPGGGLERAVDAGVVVVGFANGRSTAFPIFAEGDGDAAVGAITVVPEDDTEDPPGPPRPQPPPGQPTPGQPTPGVGPGPGAAGPAAGSVVGTDWLASATALRGRTGERFGFRCPPGGGAGRGPFGTEVYADHSSVCTAAVHAGLLTFASGGSVTIEIRPGQDFYAGSAGQGGVTSSTSGGWPGSFVFAR